MGAGGYSFFLAFGFLAICGGRSPLRSAKNSASGRIASRMSAVEQSPLQHLYCPVFGATLKLRPSHTGQVYLFLPLPGCSLSKWSRMSNEFALDLSESSGKSDAKLPSVEYDIVILRFSPPGECEAKDRCAVGSNYEQRFFGVFR